ncbi:MAG: hypothetical protein EON90_12070 [Brevundimonas sp.]|nr:MAG: hypothetical protein EON90_12070 [Brevundimonas sp.]
MDDSNPAPPPSLDPVPTEPPSHVKAAAGARAQRLAAALRDNLKRRKAAGRAARTVKPSN